MILDHPKCNEKVVQIRDKGQGGRQGHRAYDYAVFNGYYECAKAIYEKFRELFPAPVRPRRLSEISQAPADVLASAAAATKEDEPRKKEKRKKKEAEVAADATSPAGPSAAVAEEPASPDASPSSAKAKGEATARGRIQDSPPPSPPSAQRGPAPASPGVSESERVTGPLTAAVADAYK